MPINPETYDPETCAHGLTRDEGCRTCEASDFATDEDGVVDHDLAEAFEAFATEAERAADELAAWLADIDREALGALAPAPANGDF
jgi:hypothetical protein